MSTYSYLLTAVQDELEIVHNNSLWQFFHFSFSTVLAIPMLFSEYAQVRLVALALSSLGLSACALYSFSYLINTGEILGNEDSHTASISSIRALSKFLIPTTSVWPKFYLDITAIAERSSPRNYLSIELGTIFNDYRGGRIELRSPTIDLPQLFKGHLQLDGWDFKLAVSLKDKAKILTWMVLDELSPLPEEGFPVPCTLADEGKVSSLDRMALNPYLSLFFEKTEDIILWPSLDHISRAFVPQFIRDTQARLKSDCINGDTSVFAFTTCEAGLSTLDNAFVYAALPFSRMFSSRYLKDSNSSQSPHQPAHLVDSRPRTTAPLFTRLPDVLGLLTSGRHALRVLSLSNASESYVQTLDAHADALEYDEHARRECIRNVGIRGWREERLYVRWEAGLFRAGLLTRWVVLLEGRD